MFLHTRIADSWYALREWLANKMQIVGLKASTPEHIESKDSIPLDEEWSQFDEQDKRDKNQRIGLVRRNMLGALQEIHLGKSHLIDMLIPFQLPIDCDMY